MLDDKSELRARTRALLASCPPGRLDQGSRAVSDRLTGWDAYRRARTLLAFVPLAGEIDLRPLMETALTAGRVLCLPRADWPARRLEPVPVKSLSELIPGRHGIMEPAPEAPPVPPADLDLILVPGLVFDPAGNRLGRGAGFYDRFLAEPALRALTCGVCLEEQIVSAVPTDPWDVPVKAVATDGRLIVIS